MLSGTPHGGWGRTINAAQQAVNKLAAVEDTQGLAAELRSHLQLVNIAKQMQPQSVSGLTDQEIRDNVAALSRADVSLPDPVVSAMLYRKLKLLRTKLFSDPNEEDMIKYILAVVP